MIFLRENPLLEWELSFDDIKPRLLGHWGTCPGLTLVYAHLNRLIIKYDLDMLYVIGPGMLLPSSLTSHALTLHQATEHPVYSPAYGSKTPSHLSCPPTHETRKVFLLS
jgi:xylulose-5-phosphate/fructose-6-phosphate phosphoketolase